MKTTHAQWRTEDGVLVRTARTRIGPNRNPGGLYRTADDGKRSLAGIPLTSAERAVTAAVRLGYQVAEAQIDRTARLASRLRDAAEEQVGPGPERKAVDAAERLVFKGMMSGLEWLETFAAEPGSPLMRLAKAEYRLLGSLLGFTGDGTTEAVGGRVADDGGGEAARPVAPLRRAATEPIAERSDQYLVRFRNGVLDPRPVRLGAVSLYVRRLEPGAYSLKFRPDKAGAKDRIAAKLIVEGGKSTFVDFDDDLASHDSGAWRAVIAMVREDEPVLQLGIVEVILL
jgi:hypothetical protein